jgi:ABC-type multidrug transport system ATPase subunit
MTPSSEPIVAVHDLTVRYGRQVTLDRVSLSIPRGTVYALLGRNGAGKSSLLRCLLGLQRPDGGTVRLFGRDPWQERGTLLARVGVVPEEPDAPPELTPPRLNRLCAGLHGPAWNEQATAERLLRFEVPRDTPFQSLSKGQKGAVMLALALGHAPELLVLDDPTLGLDVLARDALFGEIIRELADRGTTVLLTTHDLAVVEGLADRVGILNDHRLAVEDTVEDLKAQWSRPLEEIFASVVGRTRA